MATRAPMASPLAELTNHRCSSRSSAAARAKNVDALPTASPAMAWLRGSTTLRAKAASGPPTSCAEQLRLPTRSSSATCSDAELTSAVLELAAAAKIPDVPSSAEKLRAAVLAWSELCEMSLAGSLEFGSPAASPLSLASPTDVSPPAAGAWSANVTPQRPREQWPSPSAFGTPRESSLAATAISSSSCSRADATSASSRPEQRVLPVLKAKMQKIKQELASHKAESVGLRRQLAEEKQRSTELERTVETQSTQLTEVQRRSDGLERMAKALHGERGEIRAAAAKGRAARERMERENAALRQDVEQAHEKLLDANRRASEALRAIQQMAEASGDGSNRRRRSQRG